MSQEFQQPKHLANSEVVGLFPTALIKFKYTLDPKIRADLLQEPMVAMQGEEQIYNHLFSKDNWLLDQEKYHSLRSDIEQRITEFASYILAYRGDMIITQSWLNQNRPGEATHKHTHPNSIISGVLYVSVPKDSGTIRFHRTQTSDSRSWTFYPDGDPQRAANSYYAFDWCDVPVAEGDLILFPSYASHSVPTNPTDDSRWSLAFNAVPRDGFSGQELDRLDFRRLAARFNSEGWS